MVLYTFKVTILILTGKTDMWKSNSFPVNIKLYKSFMISILLYGCGSWTPLQQRCNGKSMRSSRDALG